MAYNDYYSSSYPAYDSYGGGYDGYDGYGGPRSNAGIPSNNDSFYNTSRGGPARGKDPKDLPTHSRLFVVHGKNTAETDLQEAFTQFGEVQGVNMLKKKDPDTRELTFTGVSFVKFKKASHAAKAIEELHGKAIGGSPKPVKILVALPDNQPGEVPDDQRLRLFIKTPPEFTEDQIREHFNAFGNVEYFNFPKDRSSQKSKGFGYVKYYRFLDAAMALEDCEPSYKPIFAEPRSSGAPSRSAPPSGGGGGGGPPSSYPAMPPAMMGAEYQAPSKEAITAALMPLPDQYANPTIRPDATTCLRLLCDKLVDERQLSLLCDIIPGFKRCDSSSPGIYEATFSTKGWAQYAHDKLHGFEYPPTCRLVAKFVPDPAGENGAAASGPADPDENTPFYPVDVDLPPIKPPVSKLDTASGYALRLFIVCHPCALAPHVLTNAFCRFGDLIDVYTLPGKNFGYAKFATIEAAAECKKLLHRANIAGCTIKVIDAEDDREDGSDAKRRRT